VRTSGWRLVIAGWDQGGHRAELERAVAGHGLGSDVHFSGPLHGAAKDDAYRAAAGFILPSFSEGLPMTILEAWSHAVPVLMTPACNLPEGFSAGAALEISTDPSALAGQLAAFMARGEADRRAMGGRGRRLVEESFYWPRIAARMCEVYGWVAGGGPKPGCVWEGD